LCCTDWYGIVGQTHAKSILREPADVQLLLECRRERGFNNSADWLGGETITAAPTAPTA
jgi:hypothetical protein